MSVPGLCESCVHWSLAQEAKDGMGDCDSDAWLRGYGVKSADVKPDSVHVEDDEGWGFFTGPKFGCVHWQTRRGDDDERGD